MKIYKNMTSEELVGEIQVISGVLAGRTLGEKQEVETVEDTIEHEGLVLRKVNRKLLEGAYVRFHNTKCDSRLKDDVIYGPVKKTMTIGDEDYNVFNKYHNRTKDTVEVFEVVGAITSQDNGQLLPWESVPVKKANQQRAELIQRAREFWDANADDDFHCEVDKEKRTVFVYKVVSDGPKYSAITGLAICRADEVFNEFIGMAIALARALEIDIPNEFLNAVQPDRFAIGQIVEYQDGWTSLRGVKRTIREVRSNTLIFECGSHFSLNMGDRNPAIIDDTNAEYAYDS